MNKLVIMACVAAVMAVVGVSYQGVEYLDHACMSVDEWIAGNVADGTFVEGTKAKPIPAETVQAFGKVSGFPFVDKLGSFVATIAKSGEVWGLPLDRAGCAFEWPSGERIKDDDQKHVTIWHGSMQEFGDILSKAQKGETDDTGKGV